MLTSIVGKVVGEGLGHRNQLQKLELSEMVVDLFTTMLADCNWDSQKVEAIC